jgi:DNA-directed RNA polymerase subunit M/transcription elongation factor TFIIS
MNKKEKPKYSNKKEQTKYDDKKQGTSVLNIYKTDSTFCPKDGSFLVPKKLGKEKLHECKKCETLYSLKKTGSMLFSKKKKDGTTGIVVIDENAYKGNVIKQGCPECDNNECYFVQFPPAFGDEGDLRIYKCTACSHTFRDIVDYGL